MKAPEGYIEVSGNFKLNPLVLWALLGATIARDLGGRIEWTYQAKAGRMRIYASPDADSIIILSEEDNAGEKHSPFFD